MKSRYLLALFVFVSIVSENICAYQHSDETLLKAPKAKPKWARPTTFIENLQWDIQLKNAFYEAYLLDFKDKKIAVDSTKDKALLATLNKILRRLKPYSLLSDLPLEVHLVDDSFVNASCLPGGGIIFFKGIFDSKKGLIDVADEDQIAAVMAHEMSHATLRHSYRQSKNAGSVAVIGELVSLGLNVSVGRGWGDLFSLAYYPSLGLYLIKYSREEEAQADLEGLYTMMNAGYNPEKMIMIWEKAAKGKEGKHGIFDSHPSNSERAETLASALVQIQAQAK